MVVTVFLLVFISSCKSNINKKTYPEKEEQKTGDVSVTPGQNDSSEDEAQDGKDKDDTPDINGGIQGQSNNPDDSGSAKGDTGNGKIENGNSGDVLSDISNKAIGNWMPARAKNHAVPSLNSGYKSIFEKYNCYFTGDTSSKVIYLTFDEGYEYKYTPTILDILKENNVKANFFVVKSYIKNNADLVKRMVSEGHIIGNHTTTHPNMPALYAKSGKAAVIKELTDTADYFKEVTGQDMPKFYRPPEGVWSEATLYITNEMGYKTILWSMAHRDWDVNKQPGKEASYNFVDENYHNGAILLLHPQSQSNTEALDSIIKNLKSKGYEFKPLTEITK